MKRPKQRHLFVHSPVQDSDILNLWDDAQNWLKRSEIAERLGLTVHPALINRIEKLVESGKLQRASIPARNRSIAYIYYPVRGNEHNEPLP